LLVAGLDVDQIGHVLERVSRYAIRQSRLARTIHEQLSLLVRIAAPLAEISFCNPGRIQLF